MIQLANPMSTLQSLLVYLRIPILLKKYNLELEQATLDHRGIHLHTQKFFWRASHSIHYHIYS